MRKTTILLLAYLPFFLNDFANIYVTDYTAWVVLDYLVRLAVMGFLLAMLRQGGVRAADLGVSRVTLTDLILWTAGTAACAMAYLGLSELVLAPYFPKGSIGSVPIDPDSPLFRFDATVGLVLVGLSEEMVCRGLTLSVLRERFSTPTAALFSALAFSLMHWSLSVHTLVDAFIYGLIFVPATLATGTIWPAAITHFLVNYVLYSM